MTEVWKAGEYPVRVTRSELAHKRAGEMTQTFGRDSGADRIKAEQEFDRRFKTTEAREEAKSYLQIEQEELELNQREHDESVGKLCDSVNFDRLQDLEFNRWFNQQLNEKREKLIRDNDRTRKDTVVVLEETERLQYSTTIGPKDPLGPDRMLAYRPKERSETGKQWDWAASDYWLREREQQQANVQELWADLAKTTPNVRAFDAAATGRADQGKAVGEDGGRTL